MGARPGADLRGPVGRQVVMTTMRATWRGSRAEAPERAHTLGPSLCSISAAEPRRATSKCPQVRTHAGVGRSRGAERPSARVPASLAGRRPADHTVQQTTAPGGVARASSRAGQAQHPSGFGLFGSERFSTGGCQYRLQHSGSAAGPPPTDADAPAAEQLARSRRSDHGRGTRGCGAGAGAATIGHGSLGVTGDAAPAKGPAVDPLVD